jgi:chlorobactene glucosyltransferase
MLFYQLSILFILLILLIITIINLKGFARVHKISLTTPDLQQFVSVLVPARNEEKSIEACIRSLCEQTYKSLEIIVLDDNSTDRTPIILAGLQKEFPEKLTVKKGNILPQGWVGKPYACHQLSMHANGQYLIFTDADTVHHPNCIESVIQFAQKKNLDFFSMIPEEIMVSFWEQITIPMIHILYFAYLPNTLITENPDPRFSAANGQFIFFTKEMYDRIGGHQSVKDNLAEDVFIARQVKIAKGRTALADGISIMQCRMYHNGKEVFEGFSKNLFPGLSYNLPAMIMLLLHFFTAYVLPIIFFLYYTLSGNMGIEWLICAIQISIATIIRGMVAFRFKMPKTQIFAQSLSALMAIAIGINSIRWAYSKKGASWKGRSYARN